MVVVPLFFTSLALGFGTIGSLPGVTFCFINGKNGSVYQWYFFVGYLIFVTLVGLGCFVYLLYKLSHVMMNAGVNIAHVFLGTDKKIIFQRFTKKNDFGVYWGISNLYPLLDRIQNLHGDSLI